VKVLRCTNCDDRVSMSTMGIERSPASNCPYCGLCCLEWRWEPSEWARRRDAAQARVREAESALNMAKHQLAMVLAESRRLPPESPQVGHSDRTEKP